jgi:hypothetical protein
MTNEPLRRCPVCDRHLDDETIRKMGLRYGKALNGLCPDNNGPSDIDHVIHNQWSNPERIVIFEYKRSIHKRRIPISEGQWRLFRALSGTWAETGTGRRLDIRVAVLDEDADNDILLHTLTEWVWPETEQHCDCVPCGAGFPSWTAFAAHQVTGYDGRDICPESSARYPPPTSPWKPLTAAQLGPRCARCREPNPRRYGPDGSPWCPACRTDLPAMQGDGSA